MIPDGEYSAVVDRLEETLAVLEVTTDDGFSELVVDEADLPAAGRHSDAALTVTIRDGDLIEATYDAEKTTERQDRAQNRFDRLSDRPPQPDEDNHE